MSACASNQNTDIKKLEPTKHETVNTLDGVTMKVKEETVSTTGLTIKFENSSDKQYIYSEDFLLERKIEGKWYEVPIVLGGPYGFDEPGYEINPEHVSEWTVDWEWLYGSLDAGDYRIIKSVIDVKKPRDFEKQYLAAEFTIV